jgi:hypothetical protein
MKKRAIEVKYSDTSKDLRKQGLFTIFDLIHNELFGPDILTEKFVITLAIEYGKRVAKDIKVLFGIREAITLETSLSNVFTFYKSDVNDVFNIFIELVLSAQLTTPKFLCRINQSSILTKHYIIGFFCGFEIECHGSLYSEISA